MEEVQIQVQESDLLAFRSLIPTTLVVGLLRAIPGVFSPTINRAFLSILG